MKDEVSAGGIVLCKGKVVVVSNRGRSWTFPKGHMKKGEDPLATAKREIYEETGLQDLSLLKDLGFYKRSRISRPDVKKKIHMFLFACKQEPLCPKDPLNPEARWLTPNKAIEILTHPKEKDFFLKQLPLPQT